MRKRYDVIKQTTYYADLAFPHVAPSIVNICLVKEEAEKFIPVSLAFRCLNSSSKSIDVKH